MDLIVLTPDKKIFEGDATSIKVPGASGQFQVLNHHAPIVSSLIKGEVVIKKTDGTNLQFIITGGYIEVLKNKVSLLVQGLIA